MKLRTRLFVMIGVTGLASSLLATAVVVPYQLEEMRGSLDRARHDLRFTGAQLRAPLLDSVYGGLWHAADERLQQLPAETKRITVCALYDADGVRRSGAPTARVKDLTPERLPPEVRVLFERHGRPVHREVRGAEGWVAEHYQPLVHGGRVQGTLLLVHSLSGLERQQWLTLGGLVLLLTGLLTVLYVISGAFLRRAVVERLALLAERMGQAGAGALDATYEDSPGWFDEIGSIGASYNQMLAGLRERLRIRATLGRYVSEDIARMVLERGDSNVLGGEERIVTVLITDLRNYSTICEHLPPGDVVRALNAYMTAMGELIDAHGGCVIEYLGDAILCVFGAPAEMPNHPEAAVRCGVAMVQRLASLNQTWEKDGSAKLWQAQGVQELGARMGIHTGRVVAGTVGSASRVKYAVVGDAVNVAARLEALNKTTGTDLLVSGSTYELLPAPLRAVAEDKGEHLLKGRETPVRAYTVSGPLQAPDADPTSVIGA